MAKRRQNSVQPNPEWIDTSREVRQLSPREQHVLDLIGRGKTTKEIAAILNLSTGTIGNHRRSICHKWNIHSTAELAYRARLGKP